jgi:hypothetical protein
LVEADSALVEAHVQAGSQDLAVFNAIAKIYINNPEQLLKENNVRDIFFFDFIAYYSVQVYLGTSRWSLESSAKHTIHI